ncbi:MAG: hypothetical protein GY838_05645 [bacterium]|nr:hypothetical protein [bacterium]
MLDATSYNSPDNSFFVSAFHPTGLTTLDAAWGAGLPEGGICELRADDAVDFMAITRQLINGFVERGQNVAYFCIVDNPLPSPIPETGGHAASEDGHSRGRLDVYCRSTYGQVERKLNVLKDEGMHYAAIIVDTISLNPSGCPTPYTDDEGLPCSPCFRTARNAFLRYCREVVESLDSALLLLEHTLEDPTDDPQGGVWRPQLDQGSLVDARTIILPWEEAPGADFHEGLTPRPNAAAWTSTKYLDKTINPAPLYPDYDGGIDDEYSLGALLVLHEMIKWSAEGFILPDEAEPVADLEAVRDWVVANLDRVKSVAINIAK